jgi:hypothetical protein
MAVQIPASGVTPYAIPHANASGAHKAYGEAAVRS